jgi:hypothetical protein
MTASVSLMLLLGDDEGLAVGQVELDGDVARHLEVLLLVLADGHDVRVEEDDVGGHEHRVGKEAEIGIDALGGLVLVAVRALEQAHGRERADQPGEFADLGDVALAPEDGLGGVEAAGQPVEGDALGVGAALPGVGQRRHRVVVGDEVVGVAAGLQLDGRAHGAEVVADVKGAGGRDAG